MKNYFLNRQINRIEKEGNDDFLQILSFGARYYSVRELHYLLRKLDQEAQRLAYYRRILFLVGGTITLWIAMAFLFEALQFKMGFYFTISMIPVSILFFTAGSIIINQRFKTIREAYIIEKIIVEEIDRRRKDAPIY